MSEPEPLTEVRDVPDVEPWLTAFMEAVYPGGGSLALASFSEQTTLTDATERIAALEAERDALAEKGEAMCLALGCAYMAMHEAASAPTWEECQQRLADALKAARSPARSATVAAAVRHAAAAAASYRYFQDVPKADRDKATMHELFRVENVALWAYMDALAACRDARDAEKGAEL